MPGYDAHSEPLATASTRAMAVGLDVFADLLPDGTGESEVFGRVVSAWCRLHGFVGLELGGNFAAMGVDADDLLRREVDGLLAG